MCLVKTPKVQTGTEKPKEPTIIRNPYLDGIGPEQRAMRQGRSSLRIVRARNAPVAPSPSPEPVAPLPGTTPLPGGGRGGIAPTAPIYGGGRIRSTGGMNVRPV